MLVIKTQEELQVMKTRMIEQIKLGLEVKFLEKREAKEKEPALSEDILGVTFSPNDARVNPMRLCHGFIKKAIQLGAKVFTNTEVIGIKTRKNKFIYHIPPPAARIIDSI